jgi:intein/homing endonuclease
MSEDMIRELAKSFMVGDADKVVDIITFTKAPWGLNFKPRPAQAVILKCFYSLPLDDIEKTVVVPDMLNSKILYRFTEKEFVEFLYDEGRLNTKDFSGKNFRELIVVSGRRGGKCRYEKDLISTTEGSMTFGELLERNKKCEKVGILTYEPKTLRLEVTYDYSIWDNGVRDCLQLMTKRGVKEISSSGHRYLVWRDIWSAPRFIKLEELVVGDSIAVPKQTIFGRGCVGIDRAKILGYLQGDGGTTHSVIFTSASENQVLEFKSIISKEFPECIVKKKGKDAWRLGWEVTKKSGRKKQNGSMKNPMTEWLRTIDCFGKKAIDKEVPSCILGGSREEVAAFLSRLFACDGWAVIDKKKDKTHRLPKLEIGYGSSSDKLIQGVRHLLLKFGIQSTVRSKMATCDGKKFKTFTLSICGVESLIAFAEEIGIFTKESAVLRIKAIAQEKGKTKGYFYSVPMGVWKYIEDVQKQKKLSDRQVCGKDENARLRRCYAPCREKVAQYGLNIGDGFLYGLGTSDVYWDKVQSVRSVGEKRTIDLCVNNTHTIGGDIISHNSTISACISDYEMYKLIKRSDPSRYYGFPPETQICVMNVAPTDEQAGILYDMTLSFAMNCPYLRDRTVNQTQSYFNLQTDADRKSSVKKKRASVVGITGGCASNSLRGRNNIVVLMDEFAFFIDNGGRFSGAEVYKALTPSTATFKGDGKVVCISSPYAKYGAFWDRYNQSFEEEDTTLMFRMYSAMMNPEVDPTLLRVEYRRDRTKFMCEYGGEFSDSITSWLDDEERTKVRVASNRTPIRGQPHVPYFMGIDLGLKNDGTAIAIVHRDEKTKKIILDYADVQYSGSSDVWDFTKSIYKDCNKYASQVLIPIDKIVEDIIELCKWYPIKSGWFDQWNGYSLYEQLTNKGCKQFHMEQVTEQMNNRVYQVVKMLMMDGLVELYNHPVLVPEIYSLEAERRAKNKTIVRAPNMRGAHDDVTDAFVRAVYEAYDHHKDKPQKVTSLVGKAGTVLSGKDAAGVSLRTFRMMRTKMHGGNPRYATKKQILKKAIGSRR